LITGIPFYTFNAPFVDRHATHCKARDDGSDYLMKMVLVSKIDYYQKYFFSKA